MFDDQIAKFIYATNSSFRIVEDDKFIRLIQLLRPGYSTPSRFDISGKWLDVVHKKCLECNKEMLKDKTVCMSFEYTKQRNKVLKNIRNDLKEEQNTVAQQYKTNPKKFWKYVNSKTKHIEKIGDLKKKDEHGNTIRDAILTCARKPT